MEQLTIYKFLEEKKDFLFPNDKYTESQIEAALTEAPDSFEFTLKTIPLRNPSTLQIISVFPGSLGVDRFYLGDIKNGILKYFTFGGIGIWWIKDIISAKNRCKAYNCKKIMEALNDPSVVQNMQKTDAAIDNALKIAKATAPIAKEVVKGAKDVSKTFEIK